MDNWTCDEFVGFVRDCTDVVDGLEIDPDSETGKQAEEVGCSLEHLALFPPSSRGLPLNATDVRCSNARSGSNSGSGLLPDLSVCAWVMSGRLGA